MTTATCEAMDGGCGVSLADYIRRKTRDEAFIAVAAERKLTFENYWIKQGFDTDSSMLRLKHEFELCWKSAQENK